VLVRAPDILADLTSGLGVLIRGLPDPGIVVDVAGQLIATAFELGGLNGLLITLAPLPSLLLTLVRSTTGSGGACRPRPVSVGRPLGWRCRRRRSGIAGHLSF
jgi:ribose/xylose/arabinose/galactoside ABC-type transport system permease subunit